MDRFRLIWRIVGYGQIYIKDRFCDIVGQRQNILKIRAKVGQRQNILKIRAKVGHSKNKFTIGAYSRS